MSAADEAGEEAAAPAPWPRVVTLAHPIQFGSERITSLEFRRGKLGDIKGMKLTDVMPVDQLMTIAARLCGKPTNVIEMLDVEDAGEVMDIALDFFTRCLAASGKKASR